MITCIDLSAQEDHHISIINTFESYKEAYLAVDRNTLLDFTHPHIIQVSGGKDFVIEDMTLDYNMYASSGLVIDDILLKQGSKIVKVGSDLHAMYPYERHLKKSKEELVEKNFFLVVSKDDGNTWSFTDMKKYDKESIKIFIPNYNERFNIYLASTHN